ncbi:MAG TPA: triose-phosphate isomerase [Bryobacterales bacterium]|nr:triose-phosphate isomerase [Bryobacterales bacterium]
MPKTKFPPLVAGNWKMNGTLASLEEIDRLKEHLKDVDPACDVMICPPFTLLFPMSERLGDSRIAMGGQDCHWEVSGAHTGDVAAEMIAETGAAACIVGHSERRADHGETDEVVNRKAAAAHRAGLVAIICIGETIEEREAGRTLDVISTQLKGSVPSGSNAANTIIAYEPVWAIGTGHTPTTEQVAEVHAHIRKELAGIVGAEEAEGMRILYGGSVKPANAAELMGVENVNGALVGGASLKADDFFGIIKAYM